MLIEPNRLIEIKIYYRQINKTKRYEVYTDEEFKKLIAAMKSREKKSPLFTDEEKKDLQNDIDDFTKKFSILSTKMLEQTWGMYNDLQEMSMMEDGDGNRRFNMKKYKETKIKKYIKEWSLKDEKDAPVPINDSNILSLPPIIAEALLRSYDEYMGVSEEDEKK